MKFVIITDADKVLHGVELKLIDGKAKWYKDGRLLPFSRATAVGCVDSHASSFSHGSVQSCVNSILVGGV